jgi:DNA polymerase
MVTRTLEEASREAATCTRCRLSQGRTQVVYGVGDPHADLMFIGEAPGFHEDRQGEPFVGAAGQLLNRMLAEVEIPREDVYINNVILCRPPGNRDPLPDELDSGTGRRATSSGARCRSAAYEGSGSHGTGEP